MQRNVLLRDEFLNSSVCPSLPRSSIVTSGRARVPVFWGGVPSSGVCGAIRAPRRQMAKNNVPHPHHRRAGCGRRRLVAPRRRGGLSPAAGRRARHRRSPSRGVVVSSLSSSAPASSSSAAAARRAAAPCRIVVTGGRGGGCSRRRISGRTRRRRRSTSISSRRARDSAARPGGLAHACPVGGDVRPACSVRAAAETATMCRHLLPPGRAERRRATVSQKQKMCRHRPVHPPSRRPRDRLRRPRGVGQAAVRRGRSIGSERASSYRTELGRRWSARDGARPPFRCYGCSDDSSAPRASQRSRNRGRRPPPRPVVLLPVGGAARSTRRTITAAAAAPPPSHVNTIIARSARRTRSSSTYRDDVPHKDLAS